MNKELIIVVDPQFDFCHPEGKLYINNAEDKIKNIYNYIQNKQSDVIFTLDMHPINHCSFEENGGMWPTHCVNFSHGAGIITDLLYNINGIDYTTLYKGVNPNKEEYSADFSLISFNKYKEVSIMGFAGDYCVLESIKELVKYAPLNCKIKVFIPGIAFIGDNTDFYDYCNSIKNLEIICQ